VSTSAVPRVPTRKQVLTDLRRQEILAAAIKVFGKKGFAATCVEDVAAAAHIAKGTLYLYFKSKEDIYATAVHLAVAQLQSLADNRIGAAIGVRDRLSTAIAVRMEFWSDQQSLYRLLLTVGREPRHRRQTNELLRSGHDHFLTILESGRLNGELPLGTTSAALDTLAWAILDLIRGANERRMDKLTEDRTPQQDAASITAFALNQLGL
jgi:AcrR family transcriptional regulator